MNLFDLFTQSDKRVQAENGNIEANTTDREKEERPLTGGGPEERG